MRGCWEPDSCVIHQGGFLQRALQNVQTRLINLPPAAQTLQIPAVPKDDRSLLHRCRGHGWVANMDHRLEMSRDGFHSLTGKTSGRPRA